jgi:hypothetical protein
MKFTVGVVSALIALGVSAASANAATVYSENFNLPGFVGTPVLTGDTSDRWADTNYYTINNFDGWTFSSDAFLAQNAADPSDGALLLNEYAGVGTTIVGLTSGDQYDLSFLLSGDNRPGEAYVLNVDVGGNTSTFNGVDGAAGTNPGTTENIYFTAVGASETLTFSQATASPSQASPIVDNILISSAPEPATWGLMILGVGMAGGALRATRKSRRLSLVGAA